ncbi:MAG: type VI secretion system tip protein VgrG [Zoogloeaceae bacterium]|nr:type VI secretion system tip protein VgrG [Rhodocyclaceae bacterium]MCP5234269.1 type VI secretion system tip protein VgrG [Zoogloeaceae bacterium]
MPEQSRFYKLESPLGENVLLFYRMRVQEELARLSQFELECLSEDGSIDPDALLGKSVKTSLLLPDDSQRDFSGYVTRFSQQGMHGRFHVYHATVHPWLWFLTRRADCRIYQHMTVPDIVKDVFARHDTATFDDRLTASYPVRKYCVQYRESDFAFVSRLLEEEGIYYYFQYKGMRNVLVLADGYPAHEPYPGYADVPFVAPRSTGRTELDHISEWSFTRQVQPGRFATTDYDFLKPSVPLQVHAEQPREHEHADYEFFDYPGEFYDKADGESYIRARRDEAHSEFELANGVTNARGIATGALFSLSHHPRADQNREYLITRSEHQFQAEGYESDSPSGATYDCRFTALSSDQQFRPKRLTPRPIVEGLQTAVVTGPAGEEIHTDAHGRVKVHFHWDRYGSPDENASCWIRTSHSWAGSRFGMIAIPRIGQEVIVEYVEGDPDRPMITGRVYNAAEMPPWDLPANKTQTGLLTRSSLGGSAANANAIRFEDKKGEEQLWLHAEKNQDIEVENDETHWVGHDRTKTIDNDETTHVKHDRTETVDNNETITIGVDRVEQVGSSETIAIGTDRTERVGNNESVTIGANRTIAVQGSETKTVALQRAHAVGVNESITIGAAQAVAVGLSQSVSIGAEQSVAVGTNLSTSIGADESRAIDGGRSTRVGKDDAVQVGKNLVLDAGDSVTIKTGSASITMKKDGTITIKGKDITVEGSGKINIKASKNVVLKGSKILQN